MRVRLVRTGLLLLLGAMGPGASTAIAQDEVATPPLATPSDALMEQIRLQRERIEVLERRVEQLLTERRGIEGSLRQIESALANLRAGLGTTETPRPLVSRAEVPSDPLASPASLMRELQTRYRTEMAGLGFETPVEREAFVSKALLWSRLTNRDLRGKRSWLVRLDDLASVGPRGHVVRMTVLDEATGLPIGEAVDVGFPAKFLERFARGSRSGRWVLTSIVIARPVFNELRTTPGVFEFPPYVGPMMEFDFDLDWFALSAWEPGEPVEPPVEEAPAQVEVEAEE